MFSIIGILIVFGAVVAGYLMEKGNLAVLLQPAELVIIAGAAAGTVLIANPLHILKKIVGGIGGAFGSSKFTRKRYLETLKMLYDVFNRARRNGLVSLEGDVEDPAKSEIFSKYPAFLKDHQLRDFICDTLRMATTGGIEPFDLDQMIENDMEVHHREETLPISALSTMADSLPGLGIVAAVLGVVILNGSSLVCRFLLCFPGPYPHLLQIVLASSILSLLPDLGKLFSHGPLVWWSPMSRQFLAEVKIKRNCSRKESVKRTVSEKNVEGQNRKCTQGLIIGSAYQASIVLVN